MGRQMSQPLDHYTSLWLSGVHWCKINGKLTDTAMGSVQKKKSDRVQVGVRNLSPYH